MPARRASTGRDAFDRKGIERWYSLKTHRPRHRGTEEAKTKNFGFHLTLDGYLCNARALDNLDLITRSLAELPDRMGMKRLIPPYVVHATANRKKDPGGWSGFVLIQESHLSVHTFPARRFISVDVYSCRNFRPAPVVAYFRRIFGIRKVEKNIVVRGKEYPAANFTR